ncbi:hypothetical protein CRM22_002776 [Opisthorchis felineus]|uniref:Uncharacterized protein n=1 Tax=Opisthorchis felineus TaxID=147828 RepID=A0A4S2M4H5_OPIFE|nr:hypothetical protein CRM22_002776 [Opisthorchis felineus]
MTSQFEPIRYGIWRPEFGLPLLNESGGRKSLTFTKSTIHWMSSHNDGSFIFAPPSNPQWVLIEAVEKGSPTAVQLAVSSFKQGLRAMLNDANTLIDSLKKRTLELEKQLSASYADIDRLSLDLCKLRSRLLEDGVIKYLEKRA